MKFYRVFFLGAVFASFLNYAEAATGVSTGTSNMSVLTITDGSNGLGAGPPEGGKTYLWADFESGSINPSSLGQITSWVATDRLSLNTTDQQFTGSVAMSKFTWNYGAGDISGSFEIGVGISTVSMYGARRFTASLGSNQKVFRLNGNIGYDYVMSSISGGGSFNECDTNQGFGPGFSMPANRELNQWFLWAHGSDYDNNCGGDHQGDGLFVALQNGTTIQNRKTICNCDQNLDEVRLFDNFTDSEASGPTDGSSVYQDNFFLALSYWRVTVSSDNFRNEFPVITSAWSSGQIDGRMHTGRIPDGAAIQYRVYGGQNQVITQSSVTTGVGQTSLSPYFEGTTSSSVTVKNTGVGAASYQQVMCADSGCSTVISSGISTNGTTTYTSLNPGTTYFYKVKISTEDDAAYNSAISTVTYSSRIAVTTASITSSGATINVNTTGNFSYTVSVNSDFSSPLTSSTVSGANSISVTGAAASTSYFYQVKFSTDGNGGYNQDAFTTTAAQAGAATPPAPPKIQGNVRVSGNVRFGRP